MSNKQPEALRMADALMMGNAMIPEIDLPEAAAELRRLHDVDRDRDELRNAISEANTLIEYQMDVIQQRNTMLANSFAERDAKASQIAQLHIELDALNVARVTAEKERDKLHAEVEALRADGERYQWLRNEAEDSDWEMFVYQEIDALDAAVDAARGVA